MEPVTLNIFKIILEICASSLGFSNVRVISVFSQDRLDFWVVFPPRSVVVIPGFLKVDSWLVEASNYKLVALSTSILWVLAASLIVVISALELWLLVVIVAILHRSLSGLNFRVKTGLELLLCHHGVNLSHYISLLVESFEIVDFKVVVVEGVLQLVNQLVCNLNCSASSDHFEVVWFLLESGKCLVKISAKRSLVGDFHLKIIGASFSSLIVVLVVGSVTKESLGLVVVVVVVSASELVVLVHLSVVVIV